MNINKAVIIALLLTGKLIAHEEDSAPSRATYSDRQNLSIRHVATTMRYDITTDEVKLIKVAAKEALAISPDSNLNRLLFSTATDMINIMIRAKASADARK